MDDILSSSLGQEDFDIFILEDEFRSVLFNAIKNVSDENKENNFKNFIASYQLHTTPLELIKELEKLYDHFKEKNDSINATNTALFISKWIATDDSTILSNPEVHERFELLSDRVSELRAKRQKLNHIHRKLAMSTELTPDLSMILNQPILSMNTSLLAKNLTLVDWKLFKKVTTEEFLHNAWQGEERHHHAPYLTALAERFDKVSFWVATRVVTAEGFRKQASIIEKFIDLMIKLREYHNYNSLLQILAGLNLSSVQRLKLVWNKVSSNFIEKFKEIDMLMSPKNNYFNYREELKSAELLNTPLLPYVALFLRDITHLNDGNPDDRDKINVGKMELFGEQMNKLKSYQQNPYTFELDETLYHYLSNLQSALSDEDLYNLSVKCHPTTSPGQKKKSLSKWSFRVRGDMLSLRDLNSARTVEKSRSAPEKSLLSDIDSDTDPDVYTLQSTINILNNTTHITDHHSNSTPNSILILSNNNNNNNTNNDYLSSDNSDDEQNMIPSARAQIQLKKSSSVSIGFGESDLIPSTNVDTSNNTTVKSQKRSNALSLTSTIKKRSSSYIHAKKDDAISSDSIDPQVKEKTKRKKSANILKFFRRK